MSGVYYRIIDANLNRLREGIRVVEEYFRFASEDGAEIAELLKCCRQSVRAIEADLPKSELLRWRDTDNDPFSEGMTSGEAQRSGIDELLSANIRRAEEASRVLEEYGKLLPDLSNFVEGAKKIRFLLYKIEKQVYR